MTLVLSDITSGEMTFGRHDSGFERYNFGRDDFRAT